MSAAILDRARAFEMIAQHLPDAKRKEIAEAIADKLLAEVGGGKPKPPAAPLADYIADERAVLIERDEHDQTAAFLAARGLTGAEQVQAAGRAADYIAKHPNLTRVAALQLWWRSEHPEKESA